MPAGSAAALVCDTGALIDYLVESAPDHRLFRNAIDQARTRYVPGLMDLAGVTGVHHFLLFGRTKLGDLTSR